MPYTTFKEIIQLFIQSRGDERRGARDALVALYAVLTQMGHDDIAAQLCEIDLAELE